MVDTLHFTAAVIGLITVSNAVFNLLVQRRIGSLADRWGNRKLSIIFVLLIPLVPLIWGTWVRTTWQAITIEILSGIAWGAYNLVSFNTLVNENARKTARPVFSFLPDCCNTLPGSGRSRWVLFDPDHQLQRRYNGIRGRASAGRVLVYISREGQPAAI